MSAVPRLAHIRLNAADPGALAGFYVRALGFAAVGDGLGLGPTRLEIRAAGGRPYPARVPGWSPLFQHCAIATSDMGAALARLGRVGGWTAISTTGPERLPVGMTAFKFRDPEGHPLELIAFPGEAGLGGDPCLRIDHSALSVADTARSVAFYEGLGLVAGARTLNTGVEQARLDGVPGACVEVTTLALPLGTKPHVELLCYRGDFDRGDGPAGVDDIAATCLVFGPGEDLRDPDGHILKGSGADWPQRGAGQSPA